MSELQSEPISLYRRREITKATYEIDLLKLEEGDHSHCVYIKSPNNKKKKTNHVCRHCSYGFGSEELLNKQKEKGCMATEAQQVKMPEIDPVILISSISSVTITIRKLKHLCYIC